MNTPQSSPSDLVSTTRRKSPRHDKETCRAMRVSTVLAQDPEMQFTELREYASRRGWESVGEYVDRASGAKGIESGA